MNTKIVNKNNITKKLLIVGLNEIGLSQVEEFLNSSNISIAKSLEKEGIKPDDISKVLLKAHGVESNTSNYKQIHIDQVWNGLAMDLMMSNIDQDLWMWKDKDAISLLEYWKSLDSTLSFMLVYNSPNKLFEELLLREKIPSMEELEKELEIWNGYNRELLNFYYRNQDRCILINSQQVTSRTTATKLLEAGKKIGLYVESTKHSLEKTKEIANDNNQVDTLYISMINSLIENYPDSLAMYDELQSSANLPYQEAYKKNISIYNVISNYVKTQKTIQEEEKSLANVDAKLKEQEKERIKYENEGNTLKEKLKQIGNDKQSLSKENEFLLTQLHSVQEEFEKIYLETLSKEKKSQEYSEKNDIQIELEEKVNALIKRRDYLYSVLNQKINIIEQREEENKLLLLQLHTVQEELETKFLVNVQQTKYYDEKYYGAADRVRQQLSYRLGAKMIQESKSLAGIILLPISLYKELKDFRKDKQMQKDKLPPIHKYIDFQEAEKLKMHLSYKLGSAMIKSMKSPFGIFKLPFSLNAAYKEYKQERKMFENKMDKLFHPLQKLYDVTDLILVGSDVESWQVILKDTLLQSVHYIHTNEYKPISQKVPRKWNVTTIVLSYEEGSVDYYHLTNPYLSGTRSHEYFYSLWNNINTNSIKQKETISLKTFLEQNSLKNSTTMLVVDSFDGNNIVKGIKGFNIPIISLHMLKKEKNSYDDLMIKNGYKCIEVYEDNHPEVVFVVYSCNYKQQKHNIQKELEKEQTAKHNIQKELEKEQTAKYNIQKELEEKIDALIKRRDYLFNELNKKSKHIELRDVIIQSFLDTKDIFLPIEYLNTLSDEKIETITSYCIKQNDILEAIDIFILGSEMNDDAKFDLCCSFATKIKDYGDIHQGISYINNARYFLVILIKKEKEQYETLIQLATSFNTLQLAVDLEMEYNAQFGFFSEDVNKKLTEEYKKIRSISQKQQQHGHDLLIDYIEKNIQDDEGQSKILVEVGTTRENIPGQSSTMQLAKLCKRKGIHFITVDMDPHNTRWANFISTKLDLNIEAITKKGEDYLRDSIKEFDFVFLDAYDFDHGQHSELRQTRYEKNIGSKIDEDACHLMHLDCAKSIVKKLKEDGVVCVDDTWQDSDENWTAKGTLAVPYLLENSFKILEKRNKAVIMKIEYNN